MSIRIWQETGYIHTVSQWDTGGSKAQVKKTTAGEASKVGQIMREEGKEQEAKVEMGSQPGKTGIQNST